MIESSIGKTFLEAYNERYGTDYDARRFFIEVFYPHYCPVKVPDDYYKV